MDIESEAEGSPGPDKQRLTKTGAPPVAGVAFIASIISLFTSYGSNAVVSPEGNPGVERAVVPADVLVYTFEAFAFVLAAVGVTAVVVKVPATWRWLSSYISVVLTWIAVVFFVFITLGRQEQAEVFQAERDDLLLLGRLPGWEGFYSAGFLFFGAGMALFAATLLGSNLASRIVSILGIVLGSLLAVGAYARLVLGRDELTDAFLTPFLFLLIWLFILGIQMLRRASRAPENDSLSQERSDLPV